MADTGQERTEAATQRRRTEARRRGTVAKSSDLTSSLVMLSLLIALPSAMVLLGQGMMVGMRDALERQPAIVDMADITRFSIATIHPMLPGFLIIVVVCMGVGLVANFAQVGFKFSPEALIPNFGKLNPLAGFKRMFSAQAGFEALKAALKSLVFGWLAYSALANTRYEYAELTLLPTYIALSIVGRSIRSMAWRVVLAWATLAAIDYFFQRQQTEKQLRMTKDEVKREFKESEGSPEVKQARMQRRRRMKRQMMKAVETADVIVTNPTHYAVAIKYDSGLAPAPQVVAKGADLIALRIREEAAKHHIPIVPNPPLARELYRQCEIGDFIPKELFQAVAEVLAFVYRAAGRR
jgi:flagellar biosynthetic protein FlhB